MPKNRKPRVEQADGYGKHKARLKKLHVRRERHLAKQNPEVQPLYNKYDGYQT